MIERLVWTTSAWEDYVWWQDQDRKTLKRINLLLRDALRDPFHGLGKPEPLRDNLSGLWSRRIDETNRLVYGIEATEFVIIACRYHYE